MSESYPLSLSALQSAVDKLARLREHTPKVILDLLSLEDRLESYRSFHLDILSQEQYMFHPNHGIFYYPDMGNSIDLKEILQLLSIYNRSRGSSRSYSLDSTIKRDNRDWNIRLEYKGRWLLRFNRIDACINLAKPGVYLEPSDTFMKRLNNGRLIECKDVQGLLFAISINNSIISESSATYFKSTDYNGRNVVFDFKERHGQLVAHYFIDGENVECYAERGESVRFGSRNHMAIRDEAELQVLQLTHKYITINGISFLSADLRLLYNTFLFDTLVMTSESHIDLPNITIEDLLSLRDVFAGRKSLGELKLSGYTQMQLSGERTMLDVYDLILAKMFIDQTFVLGISLRQQLANIIIPVDVGKIVRLEELIKLVKVEF